MGGNNSCIKKNKDKADITEAPAQANHLYVDVFDEEPESSPDADQNQNSGGNTEELYTDATSGVKDASNSKAGKSAGASNGKAKATKAQKRDGKTGNGKAKANGAVALVLPEGEVAGNQYQNVVLSKPDHKRRSYENKLYHTEDGQKEELNEDEGVMYTEVSKPKPNSKSQSAAPQLNYIEVEFNNHLSKPEVKEVKRSNSPTKYMSVMNDNGKVVLLSES